MASETSVPANAEEHVEDEDSVEIVQDLVKQQNDRINQIVTQLQFLMERVTSPNDYSPTTLSSSNKRDSPTSS